MALAGQVLAQESADQRPTGRPKAGQWTFNFDAGFGLFGFANSLYTNPKPDPKLQGPAADPPGNRGAREAHEGALPPRRLLV